MPGFGGGRYGGSGGGYGGGGGGFGGGGGYDGERDFKRRRRDDEVLDPESEQFRKLFIGGLSYETSEEGLRAHFEQWGEVVDCVVMKDPESKKSRGFGFVTYKAASMIDESQENRPHIIDGREVESKRAMPREDANKNEAQATVKKMFLGGLKEDTTEDDVREACEANGKVELIEMIKDKNTGKMRGFCFVTFADHDTVDKMYLKKRVDINGRQVEVKKALSKQDMNTDGGRGGRQGGGGGGMGGGGGRFGRGGQGGNFGGSSGGGNYGQGGGGNFRGNFGGYGNQGGNFGGGQGYGNQGGNWGNQGGGYNDGYGGGYGNQGGGGGGGGNWGQGNQSFGAGYDNSYGGGAMKGQGGYSQRGSGPYGGGYGNQGGYGGNQGYGGGGGGYRR